MDHYVVIVEIILEAGGAEVALLKKVNINLRWRISNVHHAPHSDVELSILVKERSLDIFLDDPT